MRPVDLISLLRYNIPWQMIFCLTWQMMLCLTVYRTWCWKSEVDLLVRLLKLIIVLLLVVLIGAASAQFTRKALDVYFNRGKVQVPDLTGMPLAAALKMTRDYSLSLQVIDEKFHQDISKNHVISHNPPAGKQVKINRTIEVTLSKGAYLVEVPDVRGKEYREASIDLRNKGFSLGKRTYVHHEEVREEYIIAQNPSQGSLVPNEVAVDLLISKGPRIKWTVVPDLRGMNLIGLTEGKISHKLDRDTPDNTIISHVPPPGSRLREGDRVNLLISGHEIRMPPREIMAKTVEVSFVVPDGLASKKVKIVLIDDQGMRCVYSRTHQPGDQLKTTVQGVGKLKVLVYVDGALVERQEY